MPPAQAPILLFLPAHDEEATVAGVLRRAPRTVRGVPVELLVVDDGSCDRTGEAAAEAGASVVRLVPNQGLGAAVRRGLAEGVARGAAVVAFCDADGEYDPAELERLVAPILDGEADYVVGSRFGGDIRRMLPHRRVGNLVLTALLAPLVRLAVRRRPPSQTVSVSPEQGQEQGLGWQELRSRSRPRAARVRVRDGQSGYRALSGTAAARAEIIHDYNYAQVLTLDLLAKGYRYLEVPITYAFREHGRSFVRLDRYLRKVVPAVVRELELDQKRDRDRDRPLVAGRR